MFSLQGGSGGIDVVCFEMVDSLLELGHEVTLFTDSNFEVREGKVKQVRGDFLDKGRNKGRTDWKSWTLGWLSEMETGKYDRIILNDTLLYLNEEVWDRIMPLSPYIRMVYHSYDDCVDSGYFGKQIQIMSSLSKMGSKVYSVSRLLKEYLEKKYPDGVLHSNPNFLDYLPKEVDPSSFKVFQNHVSVGPPGELKSNGDFVFIGRGVKEKKLDIALKSFSSSGVGGELHVYTKVPDSEKEREFFRGVYEEFERHPKVVWHLEHTRKEVFESLRKSSVLIFPSKKESFGLVPVEASLFGMRVVYHDKHAQCYTPEDIHCERCSVSCFTKALKEVSIPTEGEKERKMRKVRSMFLREDFLEQMEEMVS
jgi:glycosyltransferase involved in cell wall biosynthesis